MKKGNRQVIRAALWLHDQYERREREARSCGLNSLEVAIGPYLDRALHGERLYHKAVSRGFSAAAERLKRRYVRDREELASALNWHLKQARCEATSVPALGALVAELASCEIEFGALEVDRRAGRISVRTESIVLDGVRLGCFRIDLKVAELRWGDLPDWFRVEALDPNPSAANDDVPHPHVQGVSLCTGEGTAAARTALIDGRICDFFVLIRSILTTYNADSAYVELEKWDGVPCHDCGYTTNEECSLRCEGCEETYCDQCVRSCTICGTILCRACLDRSEISNAWMCDRCSGECESCGRRCTTEELTEGRCTNCQEPQDQQETSHEPDSATRKRRQEAVSETIE